MFDETFIVLDEEMSDRMKYAKKNKDKLLKPKKMKMKILWKVGLIA